MTIFESAPHEGRESRTLEVSEVRGEVNLYIRRPSNPVMVGDSLGLNIAPADAPAVALATLEAAGVEPTKYGALTHGTPAHLQRIAADLQSYIKNRDAAAERAAREAERLAAEAAEEAERATADRAELQALAELIYEARINDGHGFYAWSKQSPKNRAAWINAARAARKALTKP